MQRGIYPVRQKTYSIGLSGSMMLAVVHRCQTVFGDVQCCSVLICTVVFVQCRSELFDAAVATSHDTESDPTSHSLTYGNS